MSKIEIKMPISEIKAEIKRRYPTAKDKGKKMVVYKDSWTGTGIKIKEKNGTVKVKTFASMPMLPLIIFLLLLFTTFIGAFVFALIYQGMADSFGEEILLAIQRADNNYIDYKDLEV